MEKNNLTLKEKSDLASTERLNKWKEKQAKEKLNFSYKIYKEDGQNLAKTEFNDPKISPLEKAETQRACINAATGSASENFGGLILGQAMSACFSNNKDDTFIANFTHEALIAMNPQDEYEGMLCSRLLVLHNQYMHYLARTTSPEQRPEGIDLNVNRATKLMRVWNETFDALNRYRRKGEQKVTVQHINISNGGQAVVAGEFTRGGVKDQKTKE